MDVTGSSLSFTDMKVASELQALPRSALELAARRPSKRIDLTGVLTRVGAQMHARPGLVRRKGALSKVAFLGREDEVLPSQALPAEQIFGGNQDATIVPGSAARAARQAIEFGFSRHGESMLQKVTAPLGHMKGAAVRELVLWYTREHDASILRAVIAAMPAEFEANLDPDVEGFGILANHWYDVRVCHLLLDATVANHPRDKRDELLKRMMRKSLEASARGIYAFAMRQIVTPAFYARHIGRLWHLLHDTGERSITLSDPPTHAFSRTWNWSGHHPHLCRLNQHTMAAILEMAGCREVTFTKHRCVSEDGGKECLYEFDWRLQE